MKNQRLKYRGLLLGYGATVFINLLKREQFSSVYQLAIINFKMVDSVKSIVDYEGSEGTLIEVQSHITKGLPSVTIIGYASRAVNEAKDRLRASFANSDLPFPKKRVTINLSPADIPKDSTRA